MSYDEAFVMLLQAVSEYKKDLSVDVDLEENRQVKKYLEQARSYFDEHLTV